jgi:2-oxoglutarate dehydrogenase E2 component (dihydrolipoamide succinyltransferase)
MAIALELPSLGESVIEGTVSRWLVAEGEQVEMDQPVVEVTTDKVDAEIPSPSAGVIEKILVAEGDVVEVGAQLALIDPDGQASAAPSTEPATEPAAPPAAEPAPTPAESAPPAAAAPAPAADSPAATPVARRMAEEANVSLDAISGSGSGGKITKADVMRATQPSVDAAPPASPATAPPAAPSTAPQTAPVAPEAPAAAPAPTARAASPPPRRAASKPAYATYALQEGDRVIPMTPMRRITAEHMVYSKHTSPHVGTVAEIDMGGVADVRQRHKRAFEETNGFSLTFLPFIVHSVVRALREYPALNASVIEDAIVEKRDINVGLAVETEKGLVVPVVRQADRLSLAGLAAEIDDLATRARNKKLTADDLQGGSFTVSNPGRKGNLYGFAIINQPQVGIVRMGEIVKRPVVRTVDGQDAIVIRPMMHLALSYDHRAVDGAPANGFLWRIRDLLETADFDL